MGLNRVLKHLPGGNQYLFSLSGAGLQGIAVNLDAASLLWTCAHGCIDEYRKGNYAPAAKDFQKHMIYYKTILKWDLFVFFDGIIDTDAKRHEHARRAQNHHHRNESAYIGLCAKICADLHIRFIVSREEADCQATILRDAIVVTSDSDIIAHGCRKAVIIERWHCGAEKLRIISLSGVPPNIVAHLPLYRAYLAFGSAVFGIWGALH